jgi:hypothetical protein
MKIDLKDVTFIIPIRIDSDDRKRNIDLVVSYLLTHFNTNVIIKESSSKQNFDLSNIIKNIKSETIKDNLTYVYEENNDNFFHRTKILNDMIVMSKTDIVVNYDTDIILPISSYVESVKMLKENYDVVYPYGYGIFQIKVNLDIVTQMKFIRNNFDLNILKETNLDQHTSHFGQCIFFKKSCYVNGFMENENFISYGPEDQERMYRFSKLGYRVEWYDNYVYHIEHTRSNDSWTTNPFFTKNCDLFEYIKTLSKNDLLNLYNSYDYIKKYKKI